ncbi:exophilin-5 isoform X2, partial [Sigmodon hispidus]
SAVPTAAWWHILKDNEMEISGISALKVWGVLTCNGVMTVSAYRPHAFLACKGLASGIAGMQAEGPESRNTSTRCIVIEVVWRKSKVISTHGERMRESMHMKAKIYNSPVGNQPVASVLVPKPAIMREESGMPPPWDSSQLESELFQVLDDLDSKLAQEQSAGSINPRVPFNYGSRTQFKPSHSSRNRHGHTIGRHQNYHSEISNMSIYDILRPGTPREGFKTFSPRTKTIYDMYRTREPRVLKEDFMQKNTFGSTSLCFESRQRSALPATARFTARSLHFPAAMQNKNSFAPVRHQQSPKRTPLSSITWNRSESSRHGQNQEESLGAPSPMDVDPADQYVAPKCFQERRRFELYHSQSAYQSIPLDAPINNAMNPDILENSENMPFYHQNNPFARTFFSSTFRQSGERRFGQNSFWSQQEEHSFWSDLHQSGKPFPSDRDFEMTSVEANRAPSVYSHGVPSQHWRPRSPGYGTYVFRGQEDPHWWPSNLQTSPLESMDTSHVSENQLPPYFVTQDGFSMTGSNYHSQSSGLDYHQGHCSVNTAVDEDPCLFGKVQTPVSSFRTSFPLILHDIRDSQSPSFQNSTFNLEKIISHKPDSLPIRNCTEVTVAGSHSTGSLSFTETQSNTPDTDMNSEKDMNQFISEDKQQNKMDQINKASRLPQSISQTVVANDLPDFQNAHSQDSTQSFNESATVSSRRSPREGTFQMLTTQRDKANALNKDKGFPGNRKLDSATSLPLIQEHGMLPSLPSPNQGCHQKTESNEDSSNIIKNSHWCFEPTAAQKAESSEEPGALGLERQCPSTHSTNGSKLATRHSVSQGSSDVLSGVPQDSSPLRESFLDVLLVPSTTVFSRRLPDQDPSQEEREEKDKAMENQHNQLPVNSTDNQESPDGPALLHDAVHCHPYSPFRNGRGEGRVRRHVSCIEKLTMVENRAAPTSKGSSLTEVQSSIKTPELSTVYCTLPRKPASFPIHSRQQESKITAASIRNGPLPFQMKNKGDVLPGKNTSDKPNSPKSMSDASNSIMGMPEATKKMTDMKAIRTASVRKGPLPFLIKRAISCPSGEPCTLTESDKREKSPVPDTDASAVTPRPWGRIFNSLEDDLAFKENTFSKRHNQTDFAHEHTGKGDETPAPGMSSFTPSDGSPKPLCAFGRESGKALHKFKTTSTFSVSGDEENIKCLEVVSIYYTLPRKPSKKFCSLLQQYAQGTDSLRDAFQGETKASPSALKSDELNCPAHVQSGVPPPQDLKMEVNSAPHCLSHSPKNKAVSQLPNKEASESTLEEMASVGPDVSLHKGEPKTEEIFPGSLAKTAIDNSLSRKKRGGKLSRQILQGSLLPQEQSDGEVNTKNHQQPSKGGGGGSPGLPAQSEDNVENSQTRRSSGTCVSGTATISAGNGQYPWRECTAVVVDDRSSVSQPKVAGGTTGSDCQNLTDKMLSESESHTFALTAALHKLQLAEEAQSGEADLQSETGQAGSQETNTPEMKRAENEPRKLARDQTLLPGGNNENKINMGNLETKENKYSVKPSLAVMSKASRKVPAKDLSPRRHIATIFSQSESRSGFRGLSLCRSEDSPLSPEPAVKSAETTNKSSLITVDKSETPLQATATSRPEPSCRSCNQRSANISQPHQNESNNVLDTPSKSEDSKTHISRESGTPAQPALTSSIEKRTNHQQRLSPPFPLDSAQKSTINLSHCLLRHRSAPSPESEPEPHLYRSKSLKNVNVHGDWLCASRPPKARGRHFSENTSIDTALRQLSLDDSSRNSAYSRRFKSFSELPASDENESWALCNSRTRWGPKSTSSISRPIDYGIFGKEQQLAFLENVKRSLTQGRLWKPSFLKNPGFLKDDVLNASNLSQEAELVNSGGRSPEDGLFPSEPLNIYEEDPVDSDGDTDTTTDDEYYLDENDKESEL